MLRPASWLQPLAPVTITAALTSGFNLVPWFGPDGTPVAEAVASIGAALSGVFAYVPASQTFDSFAPSLPGPLNSLTTLPFGVGLWVQVTRSATWSQPASGIGGEAVTLDFPNLGLTVEIPAGALPPGVSPDDIVARNARNSDSSFTQDGVPVRIDGWPVLSAVTLEPAGLEFLQPITVSLAVPDGPGGTPFALPLTNRIGDAVDDVRTDVAADGSAVVSWETTQAGTFAALEASIDFSASDIGSVAPGTPFSVDVTVDISGAIPTVDVGGESGVVPLAIEAATLSGTFTAPAGVTPPSVIAPASTPVAFDPPSNTVYSGDFTCTTAGRSRSPTTSPWTGVSSSSCPPPSCP